MRQQSVSVARQALSLQPIRRVRLIAAKANGELRLKPGRVVVVWICGIIGGRLQRGAIGLSPRAGRIRLLVKQKRMG